MGLLYICQLKNPPKGGVTVEINNAANSNNESPSGTREVANQINIPIQPSASQSGPFQEGAHRFQEGAHQFQEGAHQFQEDAPPNYYTTVDINTILDIPPAQRNPFETREVARYMSMRKPSAPQPEL